MPNITTAGNASSNKMEATPSMTNVAIKDGVAHIPADWIQLNPDEASRCRYAGVVACRNATKYVIPYFVFYSNYATGADYPEDFQLHVIDMCVNAWKPFTSVVLEKQVEPVKDNAKEHLNSPYIGLFSVPDEYEDSEPSCGAFITRV